MRLASIKLLSSVVLAGVAIFGDSGDHRQYFLFHLELLFIFLKFNFIVL